MKLLSLLSISLLLSACGGAAEQAPAPVLRSLQVTSDPAMDGTVIGFGNALASQEPRVGDFPNNTGRFRAIYTFDIAQIPAGAVIRSATLRVFQRRVEGAPYGSLGPNLFADHIDSRGAFDNTGNRLFDGYDLESPIGGFPNPRALLQTGPGGYRSMDVTAQVARDLSEGRTTTQYRVRFTLDTNGDNVADNVVLTDGEDFAGTGRLPLLEIDYEIRS